MYGSDAASSATDSAPHSEISPPASQTPSMSVGSGHPLRDRCGRSENAGTDGEADDDADRAPEAEAAGELTRGWRARVHGRIAYPIPQIR